MDSSDIKSITIDHYEVKGKLAQGGMGIVYLAHEEALGRDVALKFLSAELSRSPKVCERFDREAKAAAVLQHPNIVSVFFRGNFKGRPYFAMEYIDGGSLEDLGKKGLMRPDVAVDFMLQTAEGLNAAWKTGKVHRDIKPANLMVTSSNIIKIADFGLAKALDNDSSLTTANMIVGTPDFISPEQAQGDPVDCRSDIYSLGATFYYLTSGKMPFTGDTAMGILVKHISAPLPPLASQNRLLPVDFCQTIEKMMAKKAEDRFQSPEELICHLEKIKVSIDSDMEHLAGETTVAGSSGLHPGHVPSDVSSSETILSPSADFSSSETIESPSVGRHNAPTELDKTSVSGKSSAGTAPESSTGKTLLSGERARPARTGTSGRKVPSRAILKPTISASAKGLSSTKNQYMKIGGAILAILLLVVGGIGIAARARHRRDSGNGGRGEQNGGTDSSVVNDGTSVIDNGGSYAVASAAGTGYDSALSHKGGGSLSAANASSLLMRPIGNGYPDGTEGAGEVSDLPGTLSKASAATPAADDGYEVAMASAMDLHTQKGPAPGDVSAFSSAYMETEKTYGDQQEVGITILDELPPLQRNRHLLEQSRRFFAGRLASGNFVEGHGTLNLVLACASLKDGEQRIVKAFGKMALPLVKFNRSWDANMKFLSKDYRPGLLEVLEALDLPAGEFEPILDEFTAGILEIHKFTVIHPDTPRTRRLLLSFFRENKDVIGALEQWRVPYVTGLIKVIRAGVFKDKPIDTYKLSLMTLIHTRLDIRLLYEYFERNNTRDQIENAPRWNHLERAYSALFCKVLQYFSIGNRELTPRTMEILQDRVRTFGSRMDKKLLNAFVNSMRRGELDSAEVTFYEVSRRVAAIFSDDRRALVAWPAFIDSSSVKNGRDGLWPRALKELYGSLGDPRLSEIARAKDPAMVAMNNFLKGWFYEADNPPPPQSDMQKAFDQETQGAWSQPLPDYRPPSQNRPDYNEPPQDNFRKRPLIDMLRNKRDARRKKRPR